MLKYTLWNKIFHKEQLKQQDEKYEQSQALVGFGPETMQFVQGAKDFNDLIHAHKIAWERGYRNENLGPCKWGIFRTDSIEDMKPEEIYLGNIYGLWTFNIPKWEEKKDDTSKVDPHIGMTCYEIVFNQYRDLLKSNIRFIISDAEDYIEEYEDTRWGMQ